MKDLRVKCAHKTECWVCKGSGKAPKDYSEYLYNDGADCPECEGTGYEDTEIYLPIEEFTKCGG
jgi:DnaJ-class molecular chaperone